MNTRVRNLESGGTSSKELCAYSTVNGDDRTCILLAARSSRHCNRVCARVPAYLLMAKCTGFHRPRSSSYNEQWIWVASSPSHASDISLTVCGVRFASKSTALLKLFLLVTAWSELQRTELKNISLNTIQMNGIQIYGKVASFTGQYRNARTNI
jgi:hypothetical protein